MRRPARPRPSDRPWASGPNSHAVGAASRSASSRLTSPSRVVARTCRPAARSAATSAGGVGFGHHRHREDAARRGAQALAVVGVDAVAGQDTASAPIASASRISVPALPGSEISTATATRRGDPASTSVEVGLRHSAHRDESDRSHGVRQRLCGAVGDHVHRRARPAGRRSGSAAASVTKTSSTRPRRNAASTRLGPSARKRAARRRPAWRCSLIAAATRAERSVSPCQAASPDGALTSSGSAALATSTSAVNAAGSLTAISARFLRSTSTPAALRPWISRL